MGENDFESALPNIVGKDSFTQPTILGMALRRLWTD